MSVCLLVAISGVRNRARAPKMNRCPEGTPRVINVCEDFSFRSLYAWQCIKGVSNWIKNGVRKKKKKRLKKRDLALNEEAASYRWLPSKLAVSSYNIPTLFVYIYAHDICNNITNYSTKSKVVPSHDFVCRKKIVLVCFTIFDRYMIS